MDNYSYDAWTDKRRKLNNQAGYVREDFARELRIPILLKPLRKKCSNVFRELVIKHDGAVTACCMDWQRKLIIGRFPDQSLEEIWNSEKNYN